LSSLLEPTERDEKVALYVVEAIILGAVVCASS